MWYGFCRNFFGLGRLNYFGEIYMFIGIILIGIVIFVLFKNGFRSNTSYSLGTENILKERLAKGEISEEEYDNLLAKLKKN